MKQLYTACEHDYQNNYLNPIVFQGTSSLFLPLGCHLSGRLISQGKFYECDLYYYTILNQFLYLANWIPIIPEVSPKWNFSSKSLFDIFMCEKIRKTISNNAFQGLSQIYFKGSKLGRLKNVPIQNWKCEDSYFHQRIAQFKILGDSTFN